MSNERRIEIAPSILAADYSNLCAAVKDVECSGASYLHLDVMDGVFVPCISFGDKFIKDIRPLTDLIFDAHLMVMEPERHIPAFVDAGCDIITIHQESCIHLHRALELIKKNNVKCGISIVPSTPLSAIEPLLDMVDLVLVMTVNPGFGGQSLIQSALSKCFQLRMMREEEDYGYLISVDGGVNLETIQDVVAAGADLAVAGSAFFKETDKAGFMQKMQDLARGSSK